MKIAEIKQNAEKKQQPPVVQKSKDTTNYRNPLSKAGTQMKADSFFKKGEVKAPSTLLTSL